ncbi:hypothetical protein C3L33_11197, partial [Rhododendron williamsianum]
MPWLALPFNDPIAKTLTKYFDIQGIPSLVILDPDGKTEALCDLLDGGGKETLEVSVCREASEKSPRAFWAFRRLGYLQASGRAYQRFGMFTAAIKLLLVFEQSYACATELDDSKLFALVESGNINLMLGSFRNV